MTEVEAQERARKIAKLEADVARLLAAKARPRTTTAGKQASWQEPTETDPKPEAWVCPECGSVNEPRWIGWQSVDGPPHWHVYAHCDHCLESAEQAAVWEQELAERKAAYLDRYGFADPETEYYHMTFENYKGTLTNQQKAAKKAVQALCQEWTVAGYRRGIVLYSDFASVGVGKTHLAVAAARFAVEHLQSVAIWGMPTYIRALKASYDAGKSDQVTRSTEEPAVLVLDDLGAENIGKVDWYQEVIYNIMDTRWLKKRATIVTTNLPERVLFARIGARAMSRLTAMTGSFVELDGTDYRNKVKAKEKA